MRREPERRIDSRQIERVGAADRVEHPRAVFHRTAQGADLIHSPAQRHCPIAADAAERWTQAYDAVCGRWGNNGTQSLGGYTEPNRAGSGCGTRSSGGPTAGPHRVPWTSSRAAEPASPAGQFTEREFCDQHGAGVAEFADDCGIIIEDLLLVCGTTPLGRNPFRRQQILRAPWDSVQPAPNFPLHLFGFGRASL